MACSGDKRWVEAPCPPSGLALSTHHGGRSPSLCPLSWSSPSISPDRWDRGAINDSPPYKPIHFPTIFEVSTSRWTEFSASAHDSPIVPPKKFHSQGSMEPAMTANSSTKTRASQEETRSPSISPDRWDCGANSDSPPDKPIHLPTIFEVSISRWTEFSASAHDSPIAPPKKFRSQDRMGKVHSEGVKHVAVLDMPVSLQNSKVAKAA